MGATSGRHGWRRVLGPLTSVSTLLAGVYLVVGGVVAGAYTVLVVGFAQMFAAPDISQVAALVLAVLAAGIVLVPPFLGAVRTLEILAVRTFLGVDLPVPRSDGGRLLAATRWRAAAWYGLHLTAGAAATLALLLVVPLATQLVLGVLGLDREIATRFFHHVGGVGGGLLPVVAAVVMLLALPYLAVLARTVLRQAALPLLGPDQSERIAELEADARRAAERGRLARELHDSVGHALTITTLQAAAAARQVGSDDDAARRSLAAIEETGRAAMADLDHVLGLLRAQAGTGRQPGTSGTPDTTVPPVRDLRHVSDLVADARHAGVQVSLSTGTDVSTDVSTTAWRAVVPPAVSREAYRIVQEALTNAVRHAPGAAVDVRAAVHVGVLEVEVTNVLPPPGASVRSAIGPRAARPTTARPPGGGSGLAGMADRVRLLDGDLTAGPEPVSPDSAGRWVVRAHLPLDARGSGA